MIIFVITGIHVCVMISFVIVNATVIVSFVRDDRPQYPAHTGPALT